MCLLRVITAGIEALGSLVKGHLYSMYVPYSALTLEVSICDVCRMVQKSVTMSIHHLMMVAQSVDPENSWNQ